MMTRGLFPLVLSLSFLAAGCTVTPLGETAPPAAAPTAPPVNMAGRWRLVSANAGACAMTFTAAGTEGRIAPEGGCPADFFTSRYWVFEQGGLVVQDHTHKPLITMKQNAAGRFEGELQS